MVDLGLDRFRDRGVYLPVLWVISRLAWQVAVFHLSDQAIFRSNWCSGTTESIEIAQLVKTLAADGGACDADCGGIAFFGALVLCAL